MIRLICPECRNVISLEEHHLGEEVECPRCRSRFVASSLHILPERAETPQEPGRHRTDRSKDSSAVWSMVLGICSVLFSPCCGAGLLLAVPGLILGASGLQSRLRGVSIFGMVASVTGLMVSITILGLFVVMSALMSEVPPPKPDGTKAPFSH